MRTRRNARAMLSAPEGSGGFDDILFGTTGLLVVLLTWALTQIGIPEVSKETLDAMAIELAAAQQARDAAEDVAARERAARAAAKRELESERRRREQAEAAKAKAEQAKAKADAARLRAEDAQKKAEESAAQAREAKDALEPKPCDVVIPIDTTASQAKAIAALRSAALSLSEIGARLSPRFRIGVVAYNGEGFVTFPLTEVRATASGSASEGMQRLQEFLDGLGTVSGVANVESALSIALGMLDDGYQEDARQLLVLCGDVGPWEGGVLEVIEPSDRDSERRSLHLVRDFAERSDQSRVLALFTGHNSNASNKDESIAFFRSVAGTAGSRGTYSDDVSQLSATLVEALFGQ